MKMVRSGQMRVELLVESLLGVHLLGDALDDEVGVRGRLFHRLGGLDAGQHARDRALGEQPVLHEGGEVRLGHRHRLLEGLRLARVHGHVVSGGGEHLSQAGTHGAGSEDRDFLDVFYFHAECPLCSFVPEQRILRWSRWYHYTTVYTWDFALVASKHRLAGSPPR